MLEIFKSVFKEQHEIDFSTEPKGTPLISGDFRKKMHVRKIHDEYLIHLHFEKFHGTPSN